MFSACRSDKDEPDQPKDKKFKQMTLVYAVNNSSLSSIMEYNQDQMLDGLKDVDLNEFKFLIYRYSKGDYCLYEIAKGIDNKPEPRLVKSYDSSVMSIDENRIKEVIEDALDLYPSEVSNLFFWGHGLGWVNPTKYPDTAIKNDLIAKNDGANQVVIVDGLTLDPVYAFGGEYDDSKNWVYCDLDKVTEAIPDKKFDTVWFDCCYMGGIEVAYQFRNKCDYFVAYPTEIWDKGLPYNKVLPLLVKENPDRVEAARILFDHYNATNDPVTVALLDMSKIDNVADATKSIFNSGEVLPATSGLLNYSRLAVKYYDFGQYVHKYAEKNTSDSSLTESFDRAMEDFVIYKAASPYNFSYQTIDPAVYSGLSTYRYMRKDTYREEYYRKLDWYKAVYVED